MPCITPSSTYSGKALHDYIVRITNKKKEKKCIKRPCQVRETANKIKKEKINLYITVSLDLVYRLSIEYPARIKQCGAKKKKGIASYRIEMFSKLSRDDPSPNSQG